MSTDTPTPRTDELWIWANADGGERFKAVDAEEMEKIERELTAMTARAEAAEAACVEKDSALVRRHHEQGYMMPKYMTDALELTPAETRSVIAGLRFSLELHHKLLVKVGVTSTDADEMIAQANVIAGMLEDNKTYLKLIQEMYWATGNLVGDELNAVKQLASERDALRARVAELERDHIMNGGAMADKIEECTKLESQLAALISAGNALSEHADNHQQYGYVDVTAAWDAARKAAP